MQKVTLTLMASFAAACLVFFYRNVIDRALYEANEGWREVFQEKKSRRG